MEARTHALLTQYKLAPPLLAHFENGFLYKFTPGRVCNARELGREPVWRAVATRLGEWHALLRLPDKNRDKECAIWTVLQQWVDALPMDTSEESARKDRLAKELHRSLADLGQTQYQNSKNVRPWSKFSFQKLAEPATFDLISPDPVQIVLGHRDLLSDNVIIPENPEISRVELNQQISFIDYEFAMPCSAAFDIAKHFSEWGGFECDYTLLHTQAVRRASMKQYLQSYTLHAEKGLVPVVVSAEALSDEVSAYRGIPGLYWGAHALIESRITHVGFDWRSYVERRLGEYGAWRGEVDGIRAEEGREMPLCERRWTRGTWYHPISILAFTALFAFHS